MFLSTLYSFRVSYFCEIGTIYIPFIVGEMEIEIKLYAQVWFHISLFRVLKEQVFSALYLSPESSVVIADPSFPHFSSPSGGWAASPGSWELVRFPPTKGVSSWSPEPLVSPRVDHRERKRGKTKGKEGGGELWAQKSLVDPALCLPRSISPSSVIPPQFSYSDPSFPSVSPWGAGGST